MKKNNKTTTTTTNTADDHNSPPEFFQNPRANNPTRITDTTESILDHILVNTPNKISQSGVISKGFTTMIIFILLGNTLKQNQVNITLLRLDP